MAIGKKAKRLSKSEKEEFDLKDVDSLKDDKLKGRTQLEYDPFPNGDDSDDEEQVCIFFNHITYHR